MDRSGCRCMLSERGQIYARKTLKQEMNVVIAPHEGEHLRTTATLGVWEPSGTMTP